MNPTDTDVERFEKYLDRWTTLLLVTDEDCAIDTPGGLDGPAVRFRRTCYRARDRELWLDLFGCLDAPP